MKSILFMGMLFVLRISKEKLASKQKLNILGNSSIQKLANSTTKL
jgi:hypothetical protein